MQVVIASFVFAEPLIRLCTYFYDKCVPETQDTQKEAARLIAHLRCT